MSDAQYWTGYNRLLDKAQRAFDGCLESPDARKLAATLDIVLELLERTRDMRDVQEGRAMTQLLMRGDVAVPEAEPEKPAKERYSPTIEDMKKGFL